MDFSSLSLFSIMKAKLNYMSARQAVLAQNVANADTPGYRARDIAEPDFKRMLSGKSTDGGAARLKMATTSGSHITQGAGGISAKVMDRPKTDELNPNDNNVSVEEEMAKIGQNQMEYQKVLNMYGKTVSMFKIAIGNPNAGG